MLKSCGKLQIDSSQGCACYKTGPGLDQTELLQTKIGIGPLKVYIVFFFRINF
jgi:hypothetical protein